MKQYEYKAVQFPQQIGFNFKKKIQNFENQMNTLGQEGWKFCFHGNNCTIFIREKEKK